MKRIFSMIMIVSLLLCPMYPVSAQELPAANDLTFAQTLNMIDKGTEGDAGVTRGELAKILFRIVMPNVDPEQGGSFGELKFLDVPQELAVQVSCISGMKLMNGTGEETFEPDRIVSYSELVKVMVSLLGYDVRANDFGGYPAGYLRVATQLGIADSAISGAEARITYNTVASMLKRAVNVNVLEVKTFSDERKSYTSGKGASYLELYMGITHISDVLNADNLVDTTGAEEGMENCFRVRIGEKVFKTRNENLYIRDMVGYHVDAYYPVNDEWIPEILYCEATGTNIKKEIQDDALVGLKDDAIVVQDEDGGETSYKISKKTVVVYNDALCESWDASTIKPFNTDVEGWVDLIDNNGDGTYDYVLVNAYESYVSGAIKDNLISLKYRAGQYLDLNKKINGENIDILNINKEPIAFETLEEGDVLNVFKDRNGNIKKVIVSIDSFIGTISMVKKAENGRDSYTLEEMIFESSSVLTKNPQYKKLAPGAMVKLFLNMNMRICDIEIGEFDQSRYGYLYAIAESGNFKKTYKIRLFSDSGVFEEYTLADKMTVNGEDGVKAETLVSNLGTTDGHLKRQLVIYQADPDGTTLKKMTYWTGSEKTDADGFYRYPGFDGTSQVYTYTSGAGSFDGKLLLGNSTVVFSVPSEAARFDEDSYTITTRSLIRDGRSTRNDPVKGSVDTYPIEAYGRVANNPCAEAIVVTDAEYRSKTIANTADIFVIESIMQSYNPETGENENIVEGYLGTTRTSYVFKDGALDVFDGKTAEAGDIICVATDKYKKVIAATPVFRYNGKQLQSATNPSSTYRVNTNRYSYGTVDYFDGTSMKVTFGENNSEYFLAGVFNYLEWDHSGKTLKIVPASTAKLRSAQDYGTKNATKVFLYQREAYSITAVIYND